MFLAFLLLTTLFWPLACVYFLANRRMQILSAQPLAERLPRIAVIIAVRNEEKELEQALASVARMDYPGCRVLVINDRSTDKTGEIAERIAAAHPHITVQHVKTLPPGWLGKNNALYQGYLNSDEEWILFADADVVFGEGSLRRAVSWVQQKKLDHLTIFPDVSSRSTILNSIFATFKIMLLLRIRPWAVEDPSSRASVGIGAFNLIKRTAYERAGTHERIRLRPDDDLKLGEMVKAAGLRQGILNGENELRLEWYTSVNELINGLMKNTYAVLDYNIFKAAGATIGVFTFVALPLPLLLMQGTLTGVVSALIVLISQLTLLFSAPGIRARWWYVLVIPFAGLLMSFIIIRATFLTIRQGGIYWRDSFYSLSELKRNGK